MTADRIFARAPVGKSRIESERFAIEHDFKHVLIFDTETTTDFSQRLRVGAFLLREAHSPRVIDFGFFHADDLPAADMETLRTYAASFDRRVPAIVADQKAIAAREAERGDARHISTDEIDAAFAPLIDAVTREQAIGFMTRGQFAEFLIGAMRNDWPYHSDMNSFAAVVCLNALFDFGAIASPVRGETQFDTRSPVYAWGRDTIRSGKGFEFSLCECANRVFACEVVPFETDDGQFRPVRDTQITARCSIHPNLIERNLGGRKNQYGLSRGTGGPVLDLSVLGRALLGPGPSSLRALGERMGAAILKRTEETGHGTALTPEYLDYLVIDVLASGELYGRQVARYAEHGLSTPIANIFSEASIGKAYLADFSVPDNIRSRPFRTADRASGYDVRKLYEAAQEAYQGGRSEVRERLTLREVICCDFKSQYPSVNALMGLQDLLTASAFCVETGAPAINRAEALLQDATPDWLQRSANWRRLRMLVKIAVANCILPTKWEDGTSRKPYGLARMSAQSTAEKWFPLADVIGSKLLTGGHMPAIRDAIEVWPDGMIATTPRNLFGREDMRIDLARDDLFTRLIDIRTEIKDGMDALSKDAADYEAQKLVADNAQNNLKLIANSTSYGILAETMMEGRSEVAGRYYAPFIAAHITGGSRLLLAIAQTLARDWGRERLGTEIVHAMCDTDSMAFVRPAGADRSAFEAVVLSVTDYFRALSPYAKDKNLFAREKYKPGTDGAVWFFGVSCKRYCIFRHMEDGSIGFHKVSSHGLGPYRFDRNLICDGVPAAIDRDETELPYDDETDDPDAPLNAIETPSKRAKWKPWQAYMWTRAIERALGRRNPDRNEARHHAGFPAEQWSLNPTRLPQGVTTPRRLIQFAALGVRPGSFFVTMPRRSPRAAILVAMSGADETAEAMMQGDCRDVATGERLHADIVRKNATPLIEALRLYFVNPERKSRGNGDGQDQAPGRLELHTLTPSGVARRNRKGREAAEQPDMFSTIEA